MATGPEDQTSHAPKDTAPDPAVESPAGETSASLVETTDETPAGPVGTEDPAVPKAPPRPKPAVPSTRASSAWVALCVTAIGFVALIVFILQNTGRVQVSFLWMDGSAPLGVMLLIAAVGSALITALVGTIRIAQLRRLSRRRAHRPARPR